jgi:hypothetical protein
MLFERLAVPQNVHKECRTWRNKSTAEQIADVRAILVSYSTIDGGHYPEK